MRIQREWLHFKLLGDGALVNVRFHFFNPTRKTLTINVGMVVPRSNGSQYANVDLNSAGISDYTVNANGRVLKYTLMEQMCDTCPLKTPSSVVLDSMDEPIKPFGDFVFVSKVAFRPGLNVVTHSYMQFASGGMVYQPEVSYRLTTGSGWAGGHIDTFECTINPPPYSLIHLAGLPRNDGDPTFIGVGKSLPPVTSISDDSSFAYYFQNKDEERYRVYGGSIRFERHHFKPETDIRIRTYTECSDVGIVSWAIDNGDSLRNEKFREMQRSLILGWYGILPQTSEYQAMVRGTDWFIHDPQATRATASRGFRDEQALEELEKPRTR